MPLVGGSIGKLGGRDAELGFARIESDVESLEERLTVDEVKTFTRGSAEVIDDEVERVRFPADSSVKLT